MGRGTSGGRWWRRRCPAPAVRRGTRSTGRATLSYRPAPAVRRGNGSSFTSHSGPMGLSAEGQRRRPGADEGEPGRSGRQECEFCGAIPVMAFGEGSVGQGREQMVDQRADVECCRGGRQGHEFRGRLTPMTTVRCRGGWVPKTSAIRGCAMRLRGYDGGSRRMRSAGDPVCSRVAPDPGDARSRRGTRPISSRNPTDLDEGVAPGPAPGRCWSPSVRRGRATR